MPHTTQPKPNPVPAPSPVPAVLVYGAPSGSGLPQASWFRAEDRAAAKAAAAELKFSVLELQTDAEKALIAGVGEGVLKGSGRLIVGSVSRDVYRRIEEQVRKAAGVPSPSKPETAATVTKPASEHNTNSSAPAAVSPEPTRATPAGPTTVKPDSAAGPAIGKPESVPVHESLRVGARVLAAYWNEKKEFDGFWLAIVKRIEPGEYTLEWFDSPGYAPFKCRPQDIAVPHPEFRHTRK